MAEKYNSKIVFYGETLMDLTGDTVTESDVLKGKTFHDKTGAPKTGTSPFDVDSSGATATAAEILAGKTAAVGGRMVTGEMPNKGGQKLKITSKATPVAIPAGYHDGSGTAEIDDTEKAKLVGDNIREGVTILGVAGTMSGTEGAKPQSKEVTPTKDAQTVLPDTEAGYNYLSQVVVKGVPIAYADNAAGGQTVTIGA